MKTKFKIMMLAFVLVSSSLVMADSISYETGGKGSKNKSVFVVKTHKQFMGAQVQVFTSNGDLLTTQTLHKKKMIIDFCDARYGVYTIKITKGSNKEEFHFIKK